MSTAEQNGATARSAVADIDAGLEEEIFDLSLPKILSSFDSRRELQHDMMLIDDCDPLYEGHARGGEPADQRQVTERHGLKQSKWMPSG
jgi:hypothetical protein